MKGKPIAFYAAVLGIVGLTVGPALYSNYSNNVHRELLSKAGESLSLVPTTFGPWLMRDDESLSESTLKMLGCSNHVCRTYVHSVTGEAVALVFLAGPAGPLAVHTPEICLTSREYENIKPPELIEIPGQEVKHEFFATLFRAKTLEGQKLNVYYGWSRNGNTWEAPESPRMALGPLPMLFKLQVACGASGGMAETDRTAGVVFLEDLLAHLAAGNFGASNL